MLGAQLSPMSRHPISGASSAPSLNAAGSVFAVMNPDVRPSQWMAALAMRFSRVVSLVRAAVENGVLTRRDDSEMARIHARRISADMVSEIALRDGANVMLVGPTMGTKDWPTEERPPASVPVLVPVARPQPAIRCLLDVAKESLFRRFLDHNLSPPTTSYHEVVGKDRN